jgi:DMSO reductase anchor subunit
MKSLGKFVIVVILFMVGIICIFADVPDWDNTELNLTAFVLVKMAGVGLLYLFYQIAYKQRWIHY